MRIIFIFEVEESWPVILVKRTGIIT